MHSFLLVRGAFCVAGVAYLSNFINAVHLPLELTAVDNSTVKFKYSYEYPCDLYELEDDNDEFATNNVKKAGAKRTRLETKTRNIETENCHGSEPNNGCASPELHSRSLSWPEDSAWPDSKVPKGSPRREGSFKGRDFTIPDHQHSTPMSMPGPQANVIKRLTSLLAREANPIKGPPEMLIREVKDVQPEQYPRETPSSDDGPPGTLTITTTLAAAKNFPTLTPWISNQSAPDECGSAQTYIETCKSNVHQKYLHCGPGLPACACKALIDKLLCYEKANCKKGMKYKWYLSHAVKICDEANEWPYISEIATLSTDAEISTFVTTSIETTTAKDFLGSPITLTVPLASTRTETYWKDGSLYTVDDPKYTGDGLKYETHIITSYVSTATAKSGTTSMQPGMLKAIAAFVSAMLVFFVF